MKIFFHLNYLLLKNSLDSTGIWNFFAKIFFIPIFNILLFSTLVTTAKGINLTTNQLAYQYIYFIPLFSFSSALGCWEMELINNLGEEYLIRSNKLFSYRILLIFLDCLTPLILFYFLLFPIENCFKHQINLVLLFIVFSYLGHIVGFGLGFRNEKTINNFLHFSIWFLGLGPGPFLGNKLEFFQWPFPGVFALSGQFKFEWLKIFFYFIFFIFLNSVIKKPRKFIFFNR